MAERIEALHQQLESELRDVREVADQRNERLHQRADGLEEVDRELAYRISILEMQIEELRQVDIQRRREVWYLNEQRARVRHEQAQQELETVIEARRKAESQSGDRQATGHGTG